MAKRSTVFSDDLQIGEDHIEQAYWAMFDKLPDQPQLTPIVREFFRSLAVKLNNNAMSQGFGKDVTLETDLDHFKLEVGLHTGYFTNVHYAVLRAYYYFRPDHDHYADSCILIRATTLIDLGFLQALQPTLPGYKELVGSDGDE